MLTFDYLGALAVALLFPLVLAPHLGLTRTGFLFGMVNVGIALWTVHSFGGAVDDARPRVLRAAIVFAALTVGFLGSDRLVYWGERGMYGDEIVHALTTPYQRLVITRWKDDLRLYINGNLQFSSRDEHRYHEALVHPAMESLPGVRSVLILGGGDGLALREILRYPSVREVTLVDLDPEMTQLFSSSTPLVALNHDSFHDPRVHLVNADAARWVESNTQSFDVAFVDFPDPSTFALGKLYSVPFYGLLKKRLSAHGLVVVQATSPLLRTACVLVHRGDAAGGRFRHPPISHVRALVRRMGLHPGEHRGRIHAADAVSTAHALPRRGGHAGDVRLSARHAAHRRGSQPLEHPGAGALFRRGLAPGDSLVRRRDFILTAAALATAGGAGFWNTQRITASVDYPGREQGHRLRDARSLPEPDETIETDVLIAGSGIAGLTAAWQLAKRSVRDVLLIPGPEPYGNAAGGSDRELRFPTGAHYLPLPSAESWHMREMLYDFGIILNDPYGHEPTYDERYLVHGPAERVLYRGSWQDGYLPGEEVSAAEREDHQRFFALVDRFAAARGSDGRRAFAVPLDASSSDARFRGPGPPDFQGLARRTRIEVADAAVVSRLLLPGRLWSSLR